MKNEIMGIYISVNILFELPRFSHWLLISVLDLGVLLRRPGHLDVLVPMTVLLLVRVTYFAKYQWEK